MRQIIFRGKDLHDESWIYGSLERRENVDTIGGYEITSATMQDPCGDTIWTYCPVDRQTVGQFSGVNDSNNKGIFEGDIYTMGDHNIRYVVIYFDSGLIGKQVRNNSRAGLTHWREAITVIGNIHENPELLS